MGSGILAFPTKALLFALAALLAFLQYRVWTSYIEMNHLRQQIHAQQEHLDALHIRNQALDAEVQGLREEDSAIEARAREELGLIRDGEVFFQLLPPLKNRDE